jgi:hypothetical protein
MIKNSAEAPPARGAPHEALGVFLGRWRAEGKSYGGPNQRPEDPKAAAEPWVSTHVGRWHTGEFFLIQDERAMTGPNPFDTISIMGVDAQSSGYFMRSFENHGFYRHYDVAVNGREWTITGKSERALIVFSPDGRTQTIRWEWRPDEAWLPLCDRIAVRED